MQNQTENNKISRFLAFVGPFLIKSLYESFKAAGYQVKLAGRALDTTFTIQAGDNSVQLMLHNLLLEIATQDRDQEPLQFDERLANFRYFMSKSARVVNSKLAVLLPLLEKDDVEEAIENVASLGSQYERIRIWKIDQKPP